MIKNRTAQLIFQTVYCTLGLVGIVASIGIFDDISNLHWEFYVQFTNLSNYMCIAIMLVALIQTAAKKEDGYVKAVPALKFIGMLSILLTFLVFNIMLAGAPDRNPQLNWRVGSLLCHVILPIMYVLDWFLFYERKKVRWFYPFLSTLFPIGYLLFIIIHAAIHNFDSSVMIPGTSTPFIYPYFFLNLETQGVWGVVKWVLIIAVAFVAVGYVLFAIDKLIPSRSGKSKAQSQTEEQ